jgi:hypothetical protein
VDEFLFKNLCDTILCVNYSDYCFSDLLGMTNEERDQALEQRVIWNLIAKVTLTLFFILLFYIYSRRAKNDISSVSWKKNM